MTQHDPEKSIHAGESVLFIGTDKPQVITAMVHYLASCDKAMSVFVTDEADMPLFATFCQSGQVKMTLALWHEPTASLREFHHMPMLIWSSVTPHNMADYITALHQGQVIATLFAQHPDEALAQLCDVLRGQMPKLSPQDAHRRIARQLPYIAQVTPTQTRFIKTATMLYEGEK